jgi:NAD(P)-dependent dehydrogenase (short-subunit alcohol dehydrogenase family)
MANHFRDERHWHRCHNEQIYPSASGVHERSTPSFLSSSLASLTIAETWEPKHGLDISAYSASKAALNMYMVQKTKELGKYGIKVWAVDPGLNATNMVASVNQATASGAKHPSEGAQDIVDVVEGKAG